MLDIRLIREQPDFVKARLATRGGSDAATRRSRKSWPATRERRRIETELQTRNADRNRLSKEIGGKRKTGEPTADFEAQVAAGGVGDCHQHRPVSKSPRHYDERQRTCCSTSRTCRTTTRPSARRGGQSGRADLGRAAGRFPPDGEPEDHLKVGARLGLFDLERATKISGSGFVCFTGAGARLERALLNFLARPAQRRSTVTRRSAPPFIVRRECMVGTNQLPKFEDDMYGLEENTLFLTPTAEVPVTNLHREEILPADVAAEKVLRLYAVFPPRGRIGGA